jgi:hypothetical protein
VYLVAWKLSSFFEHYESWACLLLSDFPSVSVSLGYFNSSLAVGKPKAKLKRSETIEALCRKQETYQQLGVPELPAYNIYSTSLGD